MTVTDNGKRIHIPDPATKPLMQRVFRLYLEPNHSIRTITQEMAILGITTRKGRPQAKSHVQHILENPFYIGINRFDGRDYPGAQEPIIDERIFYAVQEKMKGGRPTLYNKHNPVLKNIIRCGSCGAVITWQRQKGRYYGTCQRKNDTCKGRKLLREDRVEAIIMEELQKLVSPSREVIEWVASSMRAEQHTHVEERKRILVSIQNQLARLKRMDNELYDDKLAGEIEKEKYELKHEEFKAQRVRLETKLAEIDVSIARVLEQRLVIFELAQKAATIYQTKTPEQKRQIITKLFAHIRTDNGFVSVGYTNFSRAIAERVLKTSNLLGGKI